MDATSVKPCKDCVTEGVATKRKLATKADGNLEPGPRCVTHHRAKRKVDRLRAHANRTEANFSITGEQYWAIFDWQGGFCLICMKSKGISKRLAVDHEHGLCDDHPPEKGCPKCIRALICGRCNALIGWLDVEALQRAIIVLTEAPARQILSEMMSA